MNDLMSNNSNFASFHFKKITQILGFDFVVAIICFAGLDQHSRQGWDRINRLPRVSDDDEDKGSGSESGGGDQRGIQSV